MRWVGQALVCGTLKPARSFTCFPFGLMLPPVGNDRAMTFVVGVRSDHPERGKVEGATAKLWLDTSTSSSRAIRIQVDDDGEPVNHVWLTDWVVGVGAVRVAMAAG